MPKRPQVLKAKIETVNRLISARSWAACRLKRRKLIIQALQKPQLRLFQVEHVKEIEKRLLTEGGGPAL